MRKPLDYSGPEEGLKMVAVDSASGDGTSIAAFVLNLGTWKMSPGFTAGIEALCLTALKTEDLTESSRLGSLSSSSSP